MKTDDIEKNAIKGQKDLDVTIPSVFLLRRIIPQKWIGMTSLKWVCLEE
jgi:hypothetical protein